MEEVGDEEVGEEVPREQESRRHNEHPQRVIKTSRAAPSLSRKHYVDSDDSSDEWMKVRRREPASRSKSVASPPSDEWMKVRRRELASRSKSVALPPKRAMAHAAAASAAADSASSDESTEFLFESQVAGEGSEESMPPPPPPPLSPIASSPRREPSAATTTSFRGDETDDCDTEQLLTWSNLEDQGTRENIHGAPLIVPKNQSTAHGGGNVGGSDNSRVRSAVADVDMSFISTKASIILGLSSSSSAFTTPLGRRQGPEGSQSSSNMVSTGECVADGNVGQNKRSGTAKQLDIARVLERASRLNGR